MLTKNDIKDLINNAKIEVNNHEIINTIALTDYLINTLLKFSTVKNLRIAIEYAISEVYSIALYECMESNQIKNALINTLIYSLRQKNITVTI